MLPLRFCDFFTEKKQRNFVSEMSKKQFKITAEAKDNKAVIRIDGPIYSWNNHSSNFKARLDELISQGITDAEIYINSQGGNCFEANEIANEILRFKGTTTAHLGAMCASAATYIACKCTKVIAAENVSYMIHKPSTYLEGNSDQVKADLKLLENLEKQYSKAYADKTGLSIQKIESMWIQDYWMNAEEAKELGFIDETEGQADITEEDVQAMRAFKNAPVVTATGKPNDKFNPDIQMKQTLITVLALATTASELEVYAHIDALKVKAAKADALQTELDNLKKTGLDEKVEAFLKTATDAKKFTAAQHPFWKKQLVANFEETKAVIDGMPAMVKLSEETTGTGKGVSSVDMSTWTFEDYQTKDPKALEALAKNDEAKFKELFKAHYGESI